MRVRQAILFLSALSAPTLTNAEVESEIYTIHGSGTTNPSKCFWHIMSLFEQRSHVMTRLTYRAVGSSTGQYDFLGRANESAYLTPTNTFGAGDIPIKTADYTALNEAVPFGPNSDEPAVVHLPFAISSVSLFVNIPGVDNGKNGLKLNACTAARIYSGEITAWNDAEIVNLNPGLKDALNAASDGKSIQVGRRVKGSSSTASVTKYFNVACEAEWGAEKVGSTLTAEKWGSHTKECYGSSKMTGCIRDHEGSIGYLDSGHGWSEGLTEVKLQNKDGFFLNSNDAHDNQGIQEAVIEAETPTSSTDDWGHVHFIYKSGSYTWPLVVMSYVYVRRDISSVLSDSKNQGLLKLFLEALYDEKYFGKCKELGFTEPPTAVADVAKIGIADEIDWQIADGDEWSFEYSQTLKEVGMGKFVISEKRKSLAGVSIDEIAGAETDLEAELRLLKNSYETLIEGNHDEFIENNADKLSGGEGTMDDDDSGKAQAALVLSAISVSLWIAALIFLVVKRFVFCK